MKSWIGQLDILWYLRCRAINVLTWDQGQDSRDDEERYCTFIGAVGGRDRSRYVSPCRRRYGIENSN